MKSPAPRHLLLAAATLVAASSVHAADTIWTSDSSADWNLTDNWSATNPDLTTERAVFNGSGDQNAVTFATATGGANGFGGLLVTADQTSALSITNLNTTGTLNFRLANGQGITLEAGSGAFSMGTDLTKGTLQLVLNGGSVATLQNDSANTATLGAKVTILPGGGFTPTVRFAGTGNWLVEGVISNGSGNTSLSKIGAGTLTLTGTNSYTGATTVDAGELALTGAGTIHTNSTISIAEGATFRHSGTAAKTFAAISGGGDFIRDTNTSLQTFSGNNSAFTGTMTFNTGTNLFTGANTGSADADFVANGTGNIVMATGTYAINFGSLSGNGAFRTQTTTGSGTTVTASIGALNTDTTFSGGMAQNTSALAITKVGTGKLTLSGTGKTYAGATLINDGTLALSNVGNTFVSAITVNSGTTLELNSTNTTVDTMYFNGGNITGTGTIVKTGTGWVQYRAATAMQNFAGLVDIREGTFGSGFASGLIGKDGSLMTVNVETGALFDLRGAGVNAAKIDKLTGTGRVGTTHSIASTLTVGTGNGSSQFDGQILGNGTSGTNDAANPNAAALSLSKVGTGTLTLTGVNTYSGLTTISDGTLLANNLAGSATGTGAVSVASGARLGGTGFVTGAVNVTGVIRGGTGEVASGTLTVGNVTLAAGSVVELALGASGTHSSLNFNGTESFQNGQVFSFLDLGATTGTYAGLITGVTVNPNTTGTWLISNEGWTGTFSWNAGTNAIDLNLTAIPEPSTYGLIGAGALAAVAFVRRRRKHAGAVA